MTSNLLNYCKKKYEVSKETFFRFIKDKVRFKNNNRMRLFTHYDLAFANLKLLGILPPKIKLLELFGRHGLWATSDYAPYCEQIEFWETQAIFANSAKKCLSRFNLVQNVTINVGDSIRAIQKSQISRKFNLVVSDNPIISPFSPNQKNEPNPSLYYENFDLFPSIYKILDTESIFICNMVLNPDQWCHDVIGVDYNKEIINQNWLRERKKFFNNNCDSLGAVTLETAINSYKLTVPSKSFSIVNYFYIPMDFTGAIVLFVIHLVRK